jgi:hypothetical protein
VWGRASSGRAYLYFSTKVADTTINFSAEMPNYAMATGNYNLSAWNDFSNTQRMYVGISRTFTTSPNSQSFIHLLTTNNATLTNQAGFFTFECNNIQLQNQTVSTNTILVSAKLKVNIPVIPSSNATYNVPSGYTTNSINIGGNAFPINISSFAAPSNGFPNYIDIDNNNSKSCFLFFSDNFPPSGVYDIVSSPSALFPGKLYIEHYIKPPLTVEKYTSLAGSTATVVTTSSNTAVYLPTTVLQKTGGTTTITLLGNVTR